MAEMSARPDTLLSNLPFCLRSRWSDRSIGQNGFVAVVQCLEVGGKNASPGELRCLGRNLLRVLKARLGVVPNRDFVRSNACQEPQGRSVRAFEGYCPIPVRWSACSTGLRQKRVRYFLFGVCSGPGVGTVC